MSSRKNVWRRRGRLEFRRETARYSDGSPRGNDILYVRVRKVACVIVEPFTAEWSDGRGRMHPNSVSVLVGTYRIARPAKAANYAREYLEYKMGEVPCTRT